MLLAVCYAHTAGQIIRQVCGSKPIPAVVLDNIITIIKLSDPQKRLAQYNSDKPFKTVKMTHLSRLFENVNDVERRILSYLYDNTSPTTLTKKWFLKEHDEMIVESIERAERMIDN